MEKNPAAALTIALLAALSFTPPAWAQPAAAAAAHAATPAEAFIATNVTRGLGILNNTSLSEAQRREQFESLLLSLTDTRRIAMFTLGPLAQSAPAAERDAFASAFQDYSIAVYRSYFGGFHGQSLAVTGSVQRAPDDFIVSALMTGEPGSPPLPVQFRVRTDSGKPVVTDLGVAGMWLAVSQHDSFAAYLAGHNNSVPALTAYIGEVTKRYR